MRLNKLSLLVILLCQSTFLFGRFLSIGQKWELLYSGSITDSAGNIYSVRVLPGYKTIAINAGSSWLDGLGEQKIAAMQIGGGFMAIPFSVKHLALYFQPDIYSNIGDGWQESKKSMSILTADFMGSGLVDDWRYGLNSAEKYRVRGSSVWLVKYPWEILKASFSSVARISSGTVALTAAAVYGVALRPSYELASPWLKATVQSVTGAGYIGRGGINMAWQLASSQLGVGTAYPMIQAGYNTSVGFVLGLTGREPDIVSADGWWISMQPGSPDFFKKLQFEDSLAGASVADAGLRDYALAYSAFLEQNKDQLEQKAALEKELSTVQNKIDSLAAVLCKIAEIKNVRQADSLSFMPHRYPPAPQIPPEQYRFVGNKILKQLNRQKRFRDLPEDRKLKVFEEVVAEFGVWFMVDFQVEK